MSTAADRRGGAPVGYLRELDSVEASAVVYMRHWCSGPEHQQAVWNDFARAFGGRQGAVRLREFETLMTMLVEHARRPLMRHGVSCQCLGADESAFANFIGAAVAGDGEQAAVMASLIVRPDMAIIAAGLAERVAITLAQIARRDLAVAQGHGVATHTANHVRH